jgi:hypothetical protein
LTNTNVRSVPNSRKSTVETPALDVAKFELVRLIAGVPNTGLFNNICWMLVTPDASMSVASMT